MVSNCFLAELAQIPFAVTSQSQWAAPTFRGAQLAQVRELRSLPEFHNTVIGVIHKDQSVSSQLDRVLESGDRHKHGVVGCQGLDRRDRNREVLVRSVARHAGAAIAIEGLGEKQPLSLID
jgi:hypothetical protein